MKLSLVVRKCTFDPSIRRYISRCVRAIHPVAAVLIASGCASEIGFEQVRVSDQSRAGTTHVSVLSVVNWETASPRLQPAFDLDWRQAYENALATTARTDERVLESIAIAAGVGLPRSDRTTTVEKKTDEEGKETESSQINETRVAGAAPDAIANAASSAVPRLDREDRKPVDSPAADQNAADVDLDPMIRYLAATALKQEVEMLNLYVDNALVPDGYTGYVVRLQVSLFPRARRLPYDAYTTLSFLPLEQKEDSRQPTFRIADQTSVPAAGDAGNRSPKSVLPLRIVPLLVTDNLEAIRRSASRERLRDFVLGVTALLKGLDIKAQGRSSLDEFQAVLTTDLNSLMTVGRASDNSVRVRFGASQVGPQHFSMVARTHNVTVLVLAPKPKDDRTSSMFSVVSRTEFVDAKTGQALPSLTRADQIAMASHAMQATGTARGQALAASPECLSKLLRYAEINDIAAFRDTLSAGAEDLSGYVWTDFVGIAASGPYSVTTVDVSDVKPAGAILPDENQGIVLLQETDGVTKARLVGGRSLREPELNARLLLFKNTVQVAEFPADAVRVQDGVAVEIEFKGLARSILTREFDRMVLRLVRSVADRTADVNVPKRDRTSQDYTAQWLGRTSTIEFDFVNEIVADTAGNGSLKVRVEDYDNAIPGSDTLGFRIEGAEVALDGTSEVVTPGEGFFAVRKKGDFTLKFSNLSPGRSFRFVPRADGKDSKSTTIEIVSNQPADPPPAAAGGLKLALASKVVIVDGNKAEVDLDFQTGSEREYSIYIPGVVAQLAEKQDGIAKPKPAVATEAGTRFSLLPSGDKTWRVKIVLTNVLAGQKVSILTFLKQDLLSPSVEIQLHAPGATGDSPTPPPAGPTQEAPKAAGQK